jgi:deoxyribonuclease-4
MSVAGGLHNAVLAAARRRCAAVQIFSHNSNQWRIRPLTGEDVRLWREAIARHPVVPLAHDCYLINLGSPDRALRRRSLETFVEEIDRCDALGIGALVFHPGAHMGAGEAAGLRRIAESLDDACERTSASSVRLLLETTAGQGTSLGHRFEHLAEILARVRRPERFGICLDTCHVHAAGYDIETDEGYRDTFASFDAAVGLRRLEAFHLNDSKRERGARVDRHEHIGRGRLGTRPFARLLRDPRFRRLPMVIELPKEGDMDRWNLALLRRLAR